MTDLLVTGIGHLVTNDPGRGGLAGVIENATVALVDGLVAWVGEAASLPARFGGTEVLDCGGRAVVPGFVDCHTHVVFAGDRADEFGRRLAGDSYEAILAAGGGIRSTVAATRDASADELFEAGAARVRRMLAAGTTTLEVKSGYGLDVDTERTILEVAGRLDGELPVDVVPTFLGAHVVPPEFDGRREAYVDHVIDDMLPVCAPLASFCDVFCDAGVFSVAEARRVLLAAAEHGLGARLHADQLDRIGASALAAEVGAASADHLDHATHADLQALRRAGTVAVLLPGVELSLRLPRPDGAAIWNTGVTVAIATDCNPGTSYVETMPFVVALAALELGLTIEQAVWAATRGGALALALPDRGHVVSGAVGDLVILDAPAPSHLAYRPDGDLVWKVVKRGEIVAG